MRPLRNEADVVRFLKRIVPRVEVVSGLPSHWNGIVEINEDVDTAGLPRYRARFGLSGTIHVQPAFLGTSGLHGALVHEAFHSVSAGLSRSSYREWPGFEEGVVESAFRLLAADIVGSRFASSLTKGRTAWRVSSSTWSEFGIAPVLPNMYSISDCLLCLWQSGTLRWYNGLRKPIRLLRLQGCGHPWRATFGHWAHDGKRYPDRI